MRYIYRCNNTAFRVDCAGVRPIRIHITALNVKTTSTLFNNSITSVAAAVCVMWVEPRPCNVIKLPVNVNVGMVLKGDVVPSETFFSRKWFYNKFVFLNFQNVVVVCEIRIFPSVYFFVTFSPQKCFITSLLLLNEKVTVKNVLVRIKNKQSGNILKGNLEKWLLKEYFRNTVQKRSAFNLKKLVTNYSVFN